MSASEASRIDAPLIVRNAQAVSWHDTADVLVVGFGGAGACAAIEAAQRGARVIALDRFGGGGATAYSGGVVYAGATRYQKDAGIQDSPEQMRRYLAIEVGSAVKPETLERFCAGSGADIDWLAKLGVPFSSTVFTEKTGYPPDGYFIYYSGNEMVDGYKEQAVPAPRGHRTVGPSFTGKRYFAALREAALAAGVQLMPHARVMRLIVDEGGAVLGVEALVLPAAAAVEHERLYQQVDPHKPFTTEKALRAIEAAYELEAREGIRRCVRATAGVVLSTGGYIYNVPMLQRDHPPYARNFAALLRLGSAGCDGSGIQLGQSVGGAVGLMENMFSTCMLSPPSSYLYGVMVNRHGERFINEGAYLGFVGEATARQPDGVAWLIIDGKGIRKALRQIAGGLRSGLFKVFFLPALMNMLMGGMRRASTVRALGEKCGIDAATLERTVAAYNVVAADPNATDPLHKAHKLMRPLQGPFYAVNFKLDNPFAFRQAFTLGGLRVDEATGGVQRDDGTVIPGLYAAGRAAVGLCSVGYVSGMSLADCVFSGRRAARACLERSQQEAGVAAPLRAMKV